MKKIKTFGQFEINEEIGLGAICAGLIAGKYIKDVLSVLAHNYRSDKMRSDPISKLLSTIERDKKLRIKADTKHILIFNSDVEIHSSIIDINLNDKKLLFNTKVEGRNIFAGRHRGLSDEIEIDITDSEIKSICTKLSQSGHHIEYDSQLNIFTK